ncbi:MAG: Rieske (2Fe-2S) protein [Catenulispora sp.]
MKRPIDRYVDSLLRRRRPKGFAPTEDDLAVARTAIDLVAAAPDARRPRAAFVDELRHRIAERQNAAEPPAPLPAGYRARGRRRFLAATALTATGVAAGLAGGVAVEGAASGPASPKPDTEADLQATVGTWQTVAAAADLPEGAVREFDLGAVSGFVQRVSGRLQAVSGVCTHQGCRLDLDSSHRRLACPCHGATFTLAGAPLAHPHNPHPLPALPRLPVRIDQGRVQVYAPASGAFGAGSGQDNRDPA